MSGCEKCVWIEYAKTLTEMYSVSGEIAQKIILERLKDNPSMQVFMKMELNSLKK